MLFLHSTAIRCVLFLITYLPGLTVIWGIFKKKKIKPRKAHAILNFTKIQNQVLLSVETKTL